MTDDETPDDETPDDETPDDEMPTDVRKIVELCCTDLWKHYWDPMYRALLEDNTLLRTFPGFLLRPDEVICYIGRTHIAVEYLGPERLSALPADRSFHVTGIDCSQSDKSLMENVIGFPIDGTGMALPLLEVTEGLVMMTNAGFDRLTDLKWNFSGQDAIFGINASTPELVPHKFSRLVNATFFDGEAGGLITRRIKWIDFVPIKYDDSHPDYDAVWVDMRPHAKLVQHDLHYEFPVPKGYLPEKLRAVNAFVEVFAAPKQRETEITSFLAEPDHHFILTMRFGATAVFAQLTCEWQSEERESIIPDFFVVKPNGYADIVEFKLPQMKAGAVVGRANRESFSAEIHQYIAQTRVYSSYFEDPRNRAWFEKRFGFKVDKPRRLLVVGRRHDFEGTDWREIMHDTPELELVTYDDLVDGAVVQFYL